MPRAGEYGPGVDVCCMACGNAVEAPPEIVRKVRASERAWDREVKAGETRAADLARLRAAGVDVTKLPSPAKPTRSRRMVQLDLLKPRGRLVTDEERAQLAEEQRLLDAADAADRWHDEDADDARERRREERAERW